MSLPDQTPKLPKLPFLIGDALLLAAAWFIFDQSHGRLSAAEIYAIAGCVSVGAILAAIPFLSDYARKQDEALDERQRGLEALSRTVNTAAEQISIAANGLHEIVELAHRNLKQAEQLPQKLQEKVAEFNAQLDNAREDDREELEKEVAELRASESERLQTTADKVHKDVAELTKLDAAVQKHLTARTELVNRANEAIAKAQTEVAAALNDSVAASTRQLTEAQTRALAEIDAKLAERTAAAVAAIEAAATAAARAIAASVPVLPPPAPVAPTTAPEEPTASATPEIASPPKKPRKSRREEPPAEPVAPDAPAAETPASPEPTAAAPEPSAASSESPVAPEPPASPAPAAVETPLAPAEPAATASEPAVAAPEPASVASAAPAPEPAAAAPADEPPPAPAEATAPAAAEPEEKPARKRSPRKPAPEPHAELPLDLGETASDDTPVSRSEVVERVISSDGATRLIVTAYIGIGNRLFIRGDGPGLSWDKGVPLQFVSIGKWRWETAEAAAPVSVRLYKNDETECGALGTLTLDPGHQQEVTAKF